MDYLVDREEEIDFFLISQVQNNKKKVTFYFFDLPQVPYKGLPWWLSGKECSFQCRKLSKNWVFNPWVGKIPCRRNGNPLQYSCLENPMGRGAWWATVHSVTKSWT